jgi:hypothetical protein
MGRQGNCFVIVLQLDTPPNDLLVFEYELVGEPSIDKEAIPPSYRSKGTVQWLHDEVELEKPGICVHSILFSNGWEVRLPCRDVRVLETAPVLPVSVACPVPVVDALRQIT